MARTLLAAVVALAACGGPDLESLKADELEGAQAAFLENIAAINARDVERYLAGYVRSDDLVTLSPEGLVQGFTSLDASRRASDMWPDTLVAGRPHLVWLGPGVVWGAYQYVAVQGGESAEGWSERVFVKTAGGWKIAVTGVIPSGATP
ncbi:MAG: nuclear transport factor 2 family protein [Gemmatimonadales bacterium]